MTFENFQSYLPNNKKWPKGALTVHYHQQRSFAGGEAFFVLFS